MGTYGSLYKKKNMSVYWSSLLFNTNKSVLHIYRKFEKSMLILNVISKSTLSYILQV